MRQARTVWQRGPRAEALNLLHVNKIENRLTALESGDRMKEEAMMQLQQERDEALVSKVTQQQMMLLGQIAYTVSDVLESFVFGKAGSSSYVPLSVSDFDNNTMDEPLSEEQQVRWATAKRFLSNNMPLKEIIETDKYLRWLSNQPADDRAQSRETTTAALHTWAGVYCKAKAVTSVQRYLQLLNQLSTNSRPLAPDKSIVTLVQHL